MAVNVRYPGPGWGPGLNAYLDALERGQERTMAQGQAADIAALRHMQIAGLRRGMDREAAMDALRQAVAAAPEEDIPLTPARTVARPYLPEQLPATQGVDIGAPAPAPPTETIPGQSMRGVTAEGLRRSIADPRLAAALLTPEGQQVARARGALTDEQLRERRAYAEAEQEARAYATTIPDLLSRGDSLGLRTGLGAYYQRIATMLASTDPRRAQEMRRLSEQHYEAAVGLQKDAEDKRLADEDAAQYGRLLGAYKAPGGQTPDNLAAVFSFAPKSKDWRDFSRQLAQGQMKGALAKLEDQQYVPLFQAWGDALAAQRGLRDPGRALLDAARTTEGGYDLLARALANPGQFGQWARTLIGGADTKLSEVEVARRMAEEAGFGPGQPGHWAKVGEYLRQIRDRGVEERARDAAERARQRERRLTLQGQLNDAKDALKVAEKNAPALKGIQQYSESAKAAHATAMAEYERNVLGPARRRLKGVRDELARLDSTTPVAPGEAAVPPPAVSSAPADPKRAVEPPPAQTPEAARDEARRLMRLGHTRASAAAAMRQVGWDVEE